MEKKLEKFVRAQFKEVQVSATSWLARRNEGAKLLMVLIYLMTVASVGKYELFQLIPLVLLPVWINFSLELPGGTLLRRVGLFEPMFLLVAIVNPLLTKETIAIGGMAVSLGWLTFTSLMVKSTLTLCVVFQLGMMTGIDGLCQGMRTLRVPTVIIELTALTYRYLFVLSEEALALSRAYKMRAPNMSGVHFKTWGSFAGQLILRSFDRAERIDRAMKLRGFSDTTAHPLKAFERADWLLVLATFIYAIGIVTI